MNELQAANRHYPDSRTIVRRELANGITVLAYENFASESVVVDGLVRTGAINHWPESPGLADFVSDLLMRGTAQRSFQDIYEQLESIGASLAFGSGYFTTGFAGHGLAEDLPLLLDLMNQALRAPTFPAVQVERVRHQLLAGLRIRNHSTRRMAALTFRQAAFEQHPYGTPISGDVETIRQLGRQDLIDFQARTYAPRGMIVAVVGAVAAGRVLELVDRALGDWTGPPPTGNSNLPGVARPRGIIRRFTAIPGKSQSDIVLGLPGPARSAPDFLDASLMNTILGVFGMMGRIGQRVREEHGLAYYAHSALTGGLGPGPWFASAGVDPINVERVIDLIRGEIKRMQAAPVDAQELADSIAYRTGSLPVGLETNSALANAIVDIELYELGLDYLPTVSDRLRGITAEQVEAAAQKYLSADDLVIAVAGPPPADQHGVEGE